MDTPTKLPKLSMFSQLLDELHVQALSAQLKIIKDMGQEDLCVMLLNRYSLRLNKMPKAMTALIPGVEELLPDIKRIIKIKKIFNHYSAKAHVILLNT